MIWIPFLKMYMIVYSFGKVRERQGKGEREWDDYVPLHFTKFTKKKMKFNQCIINFIYVCMLAYKFWNISRSLNGLKFQEKSLFCCIGLHVGMLNMHIWHVLLYNIGEFHSTLFFEGILALYLNKLKVFYPGMPFFNFDVSGPVVIETKS